MDFDNLLLQILDEFIEGKKVDIDNYCKKYPQYKDAILSKFRTAEFIKKNLREEDLSGKKLGEYIILQELGRGGMGIVFLGIHPALSRLTAIKVLPPSFAQDKEALKNFQEEAKIIAKFNHPNVVPIYSISDEKGVFYIAMGYISGLSLKSVVEILKINKEPGKLKATVIKEILQVPPAEKQDISQKSITLKRGFKFWGMPYFKFVATIGAEIADALSYAHQNGIVHGDLKPSNILLTNEAIPMVVDFGLSRNIKKLASSKSKNFSGTLAYAAPEQIKENTINEKTDIWSLGATLYELLTFKNPFVAKTVKGTADKILKGNPIPPRNYNKKIPIELEAIVLKCVEIKPENRYGSIADLFHDLNNFIESKPIKAKPLGVLGRTKKAIKRKPIAAVLIFMVACLSIFSFIFGLEPLTDKYFNFITYSIARGRIDKSIELFNKIEIVAPFYSYARRGLPYVAELIGESYAVKNDSENMKKWFYKAINLYIRLIASDPGFIYSYRGADLLERLGHIDEANQYYRNILVRNPGSTSITDMYLRFLEKYDKQDEALEFLAEKSRLNSSSRDNIILQRYTLNFLRNIIHKSKHALYPIDTLEKAKNLLLLKGFEKEFVDKLFSEYTSLIKNTITVEMADISKLNGKQYNEFMDIEMETNKLKKQIQQQYKESRQEIDPRL